ncbi:hypothetical protein BASA83_004875 [Batrachochytrium salamandrivorans]|nr:hypothetical protein BASA83_004875 [Batrachochytrium salamandrivorans]
MEDEDDTDAELSPPKPRRPVSSTPGDPALLQVEDANQQQQQQQLLQPQPQPRIQVDFFVADSDESDIYPASNRTPSVGGVPSSVRSLSPRKSFSSERSTSPQLGIELLPASTIADTDYWVALWSWIPPHKRMDSIELVFTTKVHGYHIKTMLNEDMSGDSYFVNASLTSLTIGGGGEHVAIHLDAELRYGSTGKCTTFMNDAFTMDKRTRFECLVVEAFAFFVCLTCFYVLYKGTLYHASGVLVQHLVEADDAVELDLE